MGRSLVATRLADVHDKLDRLRLLDPILVDVSLREACSSSSLGHILQNKIDILPLLDSFGLRDQIIASFNYQLSEHPQVEDDFCQHLQQTGHDMSRCFALTSVGSLENQVFAPHLSMLKLLEYGIPNTVHEIYLLPEAIGREQLLANLTASVCWLRERTPDAGRIYLNIVDLMDAFFVDSDWACQVLEHLATLAVDAVSFEDGRGTYFPFQVGAMVASMKALLRADQKVLLHLHAGNGMENASVIEALIEGADGYWAGMDKDSSVIGQASLGELIANLLRAGNVKVAERYDVTQLVPTCSALHFINTAQEPPADWPIIGGHAYRPMLSGFEQRSGRPMDLPAAAIGQLPSWRVAPSGSDVPAIQGCMEQAFGVTIDVAMATRMILLMRSDLRSGIRISYDKSEQLHLLYERAAQG